MATKTIADIDVSGKTVLMRVDFNVPLAGGEVSDDTRIAAALPSIRKVIQAGGRLILMSHLGRPAGKGFEEAFTLSPVAARLGELLGKQVKLGPAAVVGPETEAMAGAMADGDVVLLENVRFHAGETMPDKAKKSPDGKLTAEQRQTHDELLPPWPHWAMSTSTTRSARATASTPACTAPPTRSGQRAARSWRAFWSKRRSGTSTRRSRRRRARSRRSWAE